MSAHISYNADTLKHFTQPASPSDSLHAVLEDFDNSAVRGEHIRDFNFGSFHGGATPFEGTSYSFESREAPKQGDGTHGYAFEANGNLHYDFSHHTLYGELDSVELGAKLDSSGHVNDPGLTIRFDQPLTANYSEGSANPVHQVVWGLMNGSVDGSQNNGQPLDNSGLVAALSHEGIDLNASLESVGHAVGMAGIAAQTESDYSLAA